MDGTLKDEACCSDSFKRVMDCLRLTQGLQKVCIHVSNLSSDVIKNVDIFEEVMDSKTQLL